MTDVALMRALKALAHPTRFKMVQEIAGAGEISCGALVEKFRLAQPTISHHLKLLLEAGVVQERRQAQHHFLSVDRSRIGELLGALPEMLAPDEAPARKRPRKGGRGA